MREERRGEDGSGGEERIRMEESGGLEWRRGED